MTAPIRPLVAGNWKMNGLQSAMAEAQAIQAALDTKDGAERYAADAMLAPPATLLAPMAAACASGLSSSLSSGKARLTFAGQDCHARASGAHTGDVSAAMLKDAGASAVIVGHSERRADHGETSAGVASKASAAHAAGLTAIICVGETVGERNAGLTLTVVARHVRGSMPSTCTAANTIVAYEPVWAIGTGLTPTLDDVATVHAAIRADLVRVFASEGEAMRILYGGSVKPDNAKDLMSVQNVNGALVGGASLKARDFLAILGAYELA